MNPEVTIVIPTYNRAHVLPETLQSVLNQSFTNWECLLIDDQSTDATFETIASYLNDSRFKWISKTNEHKKGAAASRNIGIKNAKGKYINFLDSDDLLAPNKLAAQLNALKNASSKAIATCTWGRFSKSVDDAVLFQNLPEYQSFSHPASFLQALAKGKGFFPIHALLFPKELIKESGFWNESYSLYDDTDFTLRLFLSAEQFVFLDECIAYYRWQSNDNISLFDDESKVINGIKVLKEVHKIYKEKLPNEKTTFLDFLRKGLFKNLLIFYPNLIIVNFYFFKSEIVAQIILNLKRFIVRVLRILKIKK